MFAPSLIEYTECKRRACGAPLGKESRESGYHFCHKCRTCTVCGSALSAAETASALCEINSVHIRCMTAPPSSIGSEVTPSHLEYLNMFRLMMSPDPEISTSSNVEIAANTFNQFVQGVQPSLEYLVGFLSKLESVTAECHRVLAQNKTRAKLTVSIKDAKKFQNVLTTRSESTSPKSTTNVAKRSSNRAARAQQILGELDGHLVSVDETNDMLRMIAAAAKAKLEAKQ